MPLVKRTFVTVSRKVSEALSGLLWSSCPFGQVFLVRRARSACSDTDLAQTSKFEFGEWSYVLVPVYFVMHPREFESIPCFL
jgi:hypothetical protein